MSREKLKNIRNFINSAVRTYNYALKAKAHRTKSVVRGLLTAVFDSLLSLVIHFFGRLGSAVGLSAISLLALLSHRSQRMPLQSLTQRGSLIRGATTKVAETQSNEVALLLEKMRGKRRRAYKQKNPSAMLRFPLWGGDDLLSHNLMQYHRRCGA